jgi:SNF2 family DNA or RNA helicase
MSFKGSLLPYQPYAVDKMVERQKMLVAYDLGLGKTVITIAALEQLMDEQKIKEPGLIICLSSLKYQWANQIEKFTDGTSRALVIDGTPTKRAEQYAEALDWRNSKVDYVILNYEQIVKDWDYVKDLPRSFVVLDEATAIKSFRSKRSNYTKRLNDAKYRFALTGTPIENGKPEELFSIMQFVDNSVLGRFDYFDKTFVVRNSFGAVARYKNLPMFHEILSKACVRKTQTDPDVAPHLPASIHAEPIYVWLDKKTSILYETIKKDLINDLDEAKEMFGTEFDIFVHYGQADSSTNYLQNEWRGKIMSKVTALKMLCSHPGLLADSAKKYESGDSGEGSAYAYLLQERGLLKDADKSIKLEQFKDYVEDFLDASPENKLVVFATYIGMVDRIAQALTDYGCRTYTGRLDAKTKEDNKIAFNTDSNVRVLVSSDAGGYGVDLPAANLLVNYDLPWSSGGATQRNGRIKRASSKWPSIVIQDVLIGGSIEQRQYEMLQQKNSVAAAIIDGEGIDTAGELKLTLGSLRQFMVNSHV